MSEIARGFWRKNPNSEMMGYWPEILFVCEHACLSVVVMHQKSDGSWESNGMSVDRLQENYTPLRSPVIVCESGTSVELNRDVAAKDREPVEDKKQPGTDPVNPSHYQGDFVMRVIERFHLCFCLGNVVKYVLRHQNKNQLEDLKKARWYLNRKIEQMAGTLCESKEN